MGFSSERADQLWWLMVSADVNATRLLLLLSEFTLWRDDVGRVARGALGRQQRGHWDTTPANAWGAVALRKFAAAFEAAPVTGVTDVTLANGFAAARVGERSAAAGRTSPWPRAPDASSPSSTTAPARRGSPSRRAPPSRSRSRCRAAIASPRP